MRTLVLFALLPLAALAQTTPVRVVDPSDQSKQAGVMTVGPLKGLNVNCIGGCSGSSGGGGWFPDGGNIGSVNQGTGIDGGVAWNVAGSIAITNFPATQPVSGPLTDAQLRASAVPVSLSSTTITGSVAVTGPLTDTQLRATPVPVSGTVTTTPPSNASTNIAQVGGTNTVSGGVAGSLGTGGLAASGAAKAGNPLQVGGVFNTTQPTVTNGQAVEVQSTARGAQIVAVGVDGFAVSGTVTTTPPSNATTNVTQFGGTNISTGTGTGGAGIPRVTVSSDSTVTANAGTNLNTSLLALDSTLTNRTQKSVVTDGTRDATVKAASTAAIATDTALVVAVSPNNTVTVTGALTDTQLRATPVPVSGTVTANAGTNLNTSALALDATLTNRSQFAKVTDGTNDATVKAASTAAVAADKALVVAVSPNNTVTVDTEMPAAAALADTTTNPTTTSVGTFLMGFNGTSWDRIRSSMTLGITVNISNTTLAVTQSGTWNVGLSSGTNYVGRVRQTDGTLDVTLLNSAPGSDTGQVSMPVRIISSLAGGSGGTSSSFGAAFPASGTAAGFSDGTNMGSARVFDEDTGGGTQNVLGASIRIAASGGSVEAAAGAGTTGTSVLRVVLPTDQTVIPVGDNGGSLTVDGTVTTSPPANATTNVTQFGGTNISTGTGTSGAGIPRVTVSSDSSLSASVTGTVTANAGTGTFTTAGAKTNNNAAPGATNLGTLPALANAAAPTWVEGNQVSLSTDLSGDLRVVDTAGVTSSTALGALNAACTTAVSGAGTAFQLATGTLAATLIPEVSVDNGTTWVAAFFDDPTTNAKSTSVVVTNPNAATTRSFIGVAGATNVRVRVSAFTSGTANCIIGMSSMEDPSVLFSGLTNTASQPPTVAQIGGWDGTNLRTPAVKAASTAAAAADQALVVSFAAANSTTKISDGTTTAGVIVGTTALKTDLASVAGTATSTAAAGVMKVGIVGNANAAVDAANNAAAPANVLMAGVILRDNTTTTAGTVGQVGAPVAALDHVLYARPGGPTAWSCLLQAVTVTTQCRAAPAAGIRAFVTGMTCDNQAATAQTLDVVFGTGSNCATGTTALTHKYQFGTNATTTTPDHLNAPFSGSPLVPTAANAICVRPSAATAFGCTLTGFDAP